MPTRRPGTRTLVVMRHARAESFADGDHRRGLTERGRREAVEAGRWLSAAGLVPTHAFVSSASRARETWEAVALGAHCEVLPVVEDRLYTGGPDAVLDAIRGVDEGASVVLYVGHNPTAASLAPMLDDGDPDPDAFRALSTGFPPAAMAVLEVPGEWRDLDLAGGHLVACHVGSG